MHLRRYRKKPHLFVTAVRLDLVTTGFDYEKWGARQHCKQGDFIVDNAGEVYTVDAESFRITYRQVGPGQYLKTSPIWAAAADQPGTVHTKEGVTRYQAHDYLVSNDASGTDCYAVSRTKFEAMYDLDEG